MAQRRPLGIQDALWLEMDRPNNLMVIDSVVWTAEPLEWDRVRTVLRERIVDRYPVFRSRPVKDGDGAWWWELDDDFDMERHVSLVHLDDPDDPRSLQRLVASRRTEMLDRSRPLWQDIFVDRYRGGSATILRAHHAMADGIRMVELASAVFDSSATGAPLGRPSARARVRRAGGRHGVEPAAGTGPDELGRRPDAGATATTARSSLLGGAGGVAGQVPRLVAAGAGLARRAVTNPVGTAHTVVTSALGTTVDRVGSAQVAVGSLLRRRAPLVDVFSTVPGDVEMVRKVLVGTRNDATLWTGTPGRRKAVAWSDPVSLADIKAVAGAHRSTVNDVLVSCVAGALHEYLEAHRARCASVTFLVPVNLKPIDPSLPDALGNAFALVQLELPTDDADPVRVLRVARRRMERIKHGHEAAIAFRIQQALAGLHHALYQAMVDLFANRSVGVLTNVPGPPAPVYLAGSRVDGIVGWAPTSGNQPMSFAIYSYAGHVTVGIACDRELVPDHETIVQGFEHAFARLRASTPSVP